MKSGGAREWWCLKLGNSIRGQYLRIVTIDAEAIETFEVVRANNSLTRRRTNRWLLSSLVQAAADTHALYVLCAGERVAARARTRWPER